MDLWVVAAATAAAYVAKYWQNVSRSSGDDSPDSFSPNCPLSRLASGKKLNKDVPTIRRKAPYSGDLSTCDLDDHFNNVEASSGWNGLENPTDCNIPTASAASCSLMPLMLNDESGGWLTGDVGDNSGDVSSDKTGINFFDCSLRNRTFLRSRRGHYGRLLKPLSSLESCLLAQMCKEHVAVEEYVLAPFPSPSVPTTRPLLVTDGTRMIRRASGHNLDTKFVAESDNKLQRDENLERKGSIYGIPQLLKMESLDLYKDMACKEGKVGPRRPSRLHKVISGKHIQLGGSSDATVLLCLGISIGVLSSLVSGRKEVDKLKEVLRQTQNLVQDLHEELEMKDSLTVKELTVNENSELHVTRIFSSIDRAPTPISPPNNTDNTNESEGQCDRKVEEAAESMSTIEAELEAELERLEFSISTSRVERRPSDIIELEPDFPLDFAQGELRADKINDNEMQSNQDCSSESTPPPGNYSVSPRELSLRLHEVIQSRLEERVKELEIALLESQRKVQLMESERNNSLTNIWRTRDWGHKPDPENIISRKDYDNLAQPLVMNLSGEALDAYNDAYEALMKINDSEEEDSQSDVQDKNLQEDSPLASRKSWWIQKNGSDGSAGKVMRTRGRTSEEFLISEERDVKNHEQPFCVPDLLDVGLSEDENSDFDDEMEKQLIKQIVENTKQGSPVVLNAQKMLFLMDDIER